MAKCDICQITQAESPSRKGIVKNTKVRETYRIDPLELPGEEVVAPTRTGVATLRPPSYQHGCASTPATPNDPGKQRHYDE